MDYMHFLPRSCLNVWEKELDRGLRLSKGTAEYITFRVPIKATDFQKQFYPDFPGEISSYGFDRYAAGENAEPELKAHCTDREAVVEAPAPVKFEKKEQPVVAAVAE